MNDVTQILNAIENGDPNASEELLPLVYDNLRALARQRLANEKPGQTLQATALVHEAYLRLVGNDGEKNWDNRGHFFAAAAKAMRRILIDAARRKKAVRHGGAGQRVEAPIDSLLVRYDVDDLIDVHESLEKLRNTHPELVELVELKYFCGFSIQEVADQMQTSTRTVERNWAYAKALLLDMIAGSNSPT